MSGQIDKFIHIYKTLSKIPSIISGSINNAGTKITSRWSVRNIDKGKNTHYSINYVLDKDLKVIESDFGVDVTNELLTSTSPKETYRAVIREEKNEKDNSKKKFFLEVWTKNSLAHSIDLLALEMHGDVYTDVDFGTLEWSPDERCVIYIAEEKPKKTEAFIKRKPADDKDGASGDKKIKPGEEFAFKKDWGEQLTGKKSSVIVQCDIQTETLTVLQGIPDNKCPGQVRYTPDGRGVVGVVWDSARPRRLGLVYCTNRISQLFYLGFDGTYKRLSLDLCAVRSPRFLRGGDLIWLQRRPDGPHHACMKIVKLTKATLNDIITDKVEVDSATLDVTILDIVETSTSTADGRQFYGVYAQSLPRECVASDGRVVFSSVCLNEMHSYVLNVETGALCDISRTTRGSTSLLCARGDLLLASFSSITSPPQLYVAKLPKAGSEHKVEWKCVSSAPVVPELLLHLNVKQIKLEHKDTEDSVKSFTAIVSCPAEANVYPLIVWPHGGPHSASLDAYSLETAFFTLAGFAIVQVNYRGSIGAGNASVKFLPQNIGTADVKDCKLATDEVIKKFPIKDKNICLYGGSHGGFLVAHLSGQYPEVYSVAVTRNPVIDLATMVNTTDITDWCYAEVGLYLMEGGEVLDRDLLAMRRCSPMKFVHEVCAPTAIMLGSGDKRVPFYQGLEYSQRLTSNGTINKVFMYDDNHSLSSLPAEMDSLINGADWFHAHLLA